MMKSFFAIVCICGKLWQGSHIHGDIQLFMSDTPIIHSPCMVVHKCIAISCIMKKHTHKIHGKIICKYVAI